MTDRLQFWGTGDSMGVPRVYCKCEVCEEARTSGRNARLRSSALLTMENGPVLIDCGPDWKAQMERFGRHQMKHMLITHAHFDHIGGLPEWADCCRWTKEKGQVYAPSEVIETLRSQFPWLGSHLDYIPVDGGVRLGDWLAVPHLVCHGKNGTSYAYVFSRGSYRWAYCSDAINLGEDEKTPFYGLDLLVLGTSFYKEEAPMDTRSVYDVVEALELLRELAPKQCVFTHMSHGIDLRQAYDLPDGVTMAETGMIVDLLTAI